MRVHVHPYGQTYSFLQHLPNFAHQRKKSFDKNMNDYGFSPKITNKKKIEYVVKLGISSTFDTAENELD